MEAKERTLSQHIKAEREALGFTLNAMAKMLGIARSTLIEMEHDPEYLLALGPSVVIRCLTLLKLSPARYLSPDTLDHWLSQVVLSGHAVAVIADALLAHASTQGDFEPFGMAHKDLADAGLVTPMDDRRAVTIDLYARVQGLKELIAT